MKQKIIHDVIHGNIELSDLEVLLLKNSIVNRLHQILQTSAAYTVYPNLKGSRFEHSLGVMNYTGSMYKYGMINSDSELTLEFLEDKSKWFEQRLLERKDKIFDSFIDQTDHIKGYKTALKSDFKINRNLSNIGDLLRNSEFNKDLVKLIGGGFLNRNINFESSKYSTVNILLFQATRLFGLLHDIGHLPLSHLFEFSVDSLYMHLDDKVDKSEYEKEYLKTLFNLIKNRDDKLHELIGKNIAKYIFQYVLRLVSLPSHGYSAKESVANGIAVFMIKEIWEEIIKGDKGYLNSLYSIVSGTIDSDRLDFVQRDGLLSGIVGKSGNVDRIVQMFCLGKTPKIVNKEVDSYLFMPSIQSLDGVEELLHDRYRIYKFMANHHAVMRSNYIFQKIIENKLKDEISKLGEISKESKAKDRDLIPTKLLDVINLSKRIVEEEIRIGSSDEIVDDYIQLTDYWLFSNLNQEFVQAINSASETRTRNEILLIEIYKSKRSFKSLWKRGHEFKEFLSYLGKLFVEDVENFNEAIKTNPNLISFDSKIREHLGSPKLKISKYNKLSKIIIETERSIKNKTFKGKEYTLVETKESFIELENNFLFLGNKIMLELGIMDKKKKHRLMRRLELQFDKLSTEKHVLLSATQITNGVKDCYLIDRNNQKNIHKFEKYSNKVNSLDSEINDFIKFFAFYYDDGTVGLDKKVKSDLTGYILSELYNLKLNKIHHVQNL